MFRRQRNEEEGATTTTITNCSSRQSRRKQCSKRMEIKEQHKAREDERVQDEL